MLTRREKLNKKLKALRRAWRPKSKPATPVFILGEMRSGTNMLTECFENCLWADVYNESDEEAFDAYELRDLSEIRRVIADSNGSHAVFKAIADSTRAAEILASVPRARIVWIYRRYQDAVHSALAKWTGHNEYLRLIIEEPERARWRARNLSRQSLSLIRFHYQRGLSDVSARALIWCVRNRAFFDQALDERDNVMLINYEQFVTRPREHLRAVFSFVGLPFRDSYHRHVSSSSIGRRPDPDIDPAIAALCEDVTRQFEEVLARPVASDLTA